MRQQLNLLFIFIFSIVLFGIYFLLIYEKGFNLADEGFLWYGSWQTFLGKYPVVDFQSYDPFRYFYVASWFHLFDSYNIYILRLSVYSFAIFGLLGLLYITIERTKKLDYMYMFLVTILFCLWLFPYWKIFEHVVSIVSIVVLYQTFKHFDSNTKVLILTGIYTSFLFFYGRNHALYMHVAIIYLFVINYIFLKDFNKVLTQLKSFFMGYLIGLTPILYMIVFVDGYYQKIKEWLFWFIERGATTNLSKPFSFPWDISIIQCNYFSCSKIFFSIFTLLMFIIFILAIVTIIYLTIKKQRDYLLLSSSVFVIVYFHYFASRPDLGHMAQTIMPSFIFICFFFLKTKYLKYIFITCLIILSILTTRNPLLNPKISYSAQVTEHKLYIGKRQKDKLVFLDKYMSNMQESVVVIPNMISLYPMYNKTSPIYDLYLVLPRSEHYQKNMLQKIIHNNPKLIIYNKVTYGKGKRMLFKNTYPIVHKYILSNYNQIDRFNNIVIYERSN